ncbi:MAG: hypothetical protein ACKVOB_10885 [Sphingomonas sp.]
MTTAHYALSEALIIAAAVRSALLFNQRGDRKAAVAVALIGVAALLGATRHGAGLVTELAGPHEFVSALGGLLALLLLVLSQLGRSALVPPPWAQVAAVVVALVAASLVPAIGAVIFAAGFLLSVVLLVLPAGPALPRLVTLVSFGGAVGVNLLLPFATWLDPAVRWHVYHVVTAIWVAALPFCFASQRPARATAFA